MPMSPDASMHALPGTGSLARIEAPASLSPAELELWEGIVESKPANWFDAAAAPVLAEYVRAAAVCDRLAALIGAEGGIEMKALLDLRDREARRAASLATKLRLLPQSRFTPGAASTAAGKPMGPRPWRG